MSKGIPAQHRNVKVYWNYEKFNFFSDLRGQTSKNFSPKKCLSIINNLKPLMKKNIQLPFFATLERLSTPATSVADPGCLSRIPDPKTAKKERGEKKFVVIPFYVATNFTKLQIISVLNLWRKIFWLICLRQGSNQGHLRHRQALYLKSYQDSLCCE